MNETQQGRSAAQEGAARAGIRESRTLRKAIEHRIGLV
jgi:hypothetical protein